MTIMLVKHPVYSRTCSNWPIFILIISAHIVNALLYVKM